MLRYIFLPSLFYLMLQLKFFKLYSEFLRKNIFRKQVIWTQEGRLPGQNSSVFRKMRLLVKDCGKHDVSHYN